MRILLTVPSLAREFGGPVEKAFGLRDAMRDQAVQVRLIGAGIGDGEGLPVLTAVHGTPVPRSFRALRSAIDRADVVHILGYRDPVGTVAATTAFRANVPYLLEPCGMHRPRLRSILAKRAFDAALGRRIVDRAALLVATSEHERHELVQDGIPDRRIRTRMNGITFRAGEIPPRGEIRRRVGVPLDAPMVLSIGRISRTKGLTELVRAVSPLRSVHVLIAGPDDRDGTLTELYRAAPTLGGRLHVEAAGLWGMDKIAALADADCFALPSLTENFGNSAAEAAAGGLPVVVSDACGVAEILDRSAHRVVVSGALDELTEAIADLLTPGARARAVEVSGRLRSRLDWTRLARDQLQTYQEVLCR
jgi:glycosyltransferase involved in cell wall biosynthesis